MIKQQLIVELTKLVDQIANKNELFACRATCKLRELIHFIEDETDRELDAIHVKTTLALIMHDLQRTIKKSAQESTLAE